MIEGKNIICFANDWHNDPTSKHQVMKLLSQKNRVLWVNSIGMRKPSVSSSDFRRIVLKLKSFAKGIEQVMENLFVFTPIVLPLPSSPLARRINTYLLRASLWYYRKQLGMEEIQLWTFVPTMVELAGAMKEKVLVYYCVDEWAKFSFIDARAMRNMEIRLLQKADVVFTTADHLYRDKAQFNKNTYLVEHGVDHEHFSQARHEDLPIPQDIRQLQKPILGFFGLIHEWIDLDLIEQLARLKPEWSIVMIGKSSIDLTRFRQHRNVHFPGQMPYESLPSCCRGFDIGIIPFMVNDLTMNVNPIKLREYLSAGLPVISTALPEVEKYADIVEIIHSASEFVAAAEKILQNDTREDAQNRSNRMAGETWLGKVEYISQCLENVTKDKER